MDIDELVDRAIEGATKLSDSNDKEIENKKIKPYRYITDETEIKNALLKSNLESTSTMKTSHKNKLLAEEWCIIGLGDVETIEQVILKHEISRKFK
jgi:hypothetical protein